MIFSRRPTVITAATTLKLHICGTALGPTDQTRFLGFQLDNKLSWLPHITARCLIAKKQIFSCKRFLGLTWGVNSNRLKTLYDLVIEPSLLYGCSLWYAKSRHKKVVAMLRSVQRLFNILVVRAMSSKSATSVNLLTNQFPVDYRVSELTLDAQGRMPLHLFLLSTHDALTSSFPLAPPSQERPSLIHLKNHPPWTPQKFLPTLSLPKFPTLALLPSEHNLLRLYTDG